MMPQTKPGPQPGDAIGFSADGSPPVIGRVELRTPNEVHFSLPDTDEWYIANILDVGASVDERYRYCVGKGLPHLTPREPLTHPPRLFIRMPEGQRFIETPPGELWTERLTAWRQDHSLPCPDPIGHLEFERPREYGGHAWWIVSENLYVEIAHQIVVYRYRILTTDVVIHTVYEPAVMRLDAESTHSSLMSFGETTWPGKHAYYGELGSRRLEAAIDVLPSGEQRLAVCRAELNAREENAYALIRLIFPYTATSGRAYSGEITIADAALRDAVERSEIR